jgi:hypothetical protein
LVIWILALALFVVWLGLVLLGKGGFIHILLLCAFSLALVQWAAERRAKQD